MNEIKPTCLLRKSHPKPRILFMGEDVTRAHVTRPIVLAKALYPGKYDIFFGAGKNSQPLVESEGLKYENINTIPSSVFLERVNKGQQCWTTDELDSYVKDDMRLFEKLKPDLVVTDGRVSVPISADLSNIPSVFLLNANWSAYTTQSFPLPDLPIFSLLGHNMSRILFKIMKPLAQKAYARSYNAVRKSYGLKPAKDIRYVTDSFEVCQYWNVYVDIPTLAPTSKLPDNFFYIGPVMWSPSVPLPEWWNELPNDKPCIYMTMGSSGDTSCLDVLLDVLRNMSVSVIFASAGRFKQESLPDNIHMTDYIPGFKACERADVVLCNGGKETTYQALSCGKPVLGISSNVDQYSTMESIEAQKAGKLIRSKLMTPEIVSDSITELLNEQSYHKSASILKEEISKYNAQHIFREFIESLWEE